MSSSQAFPSLTTIDPGQMGTDATIPVGTDPWYGPSSYAFTHDSHIPYSTPYPSSTVESQPWTTYARTSMPDISINTYGMHPPRAPQHSPPITQNPDRPRSSPSTFGPAPESIQWTASSGLGIQYTTAGGHPTPPVTSTFPPGVFQNYPTDDSYGTASPPELRHPTPQRRHPYTPIAPNPQTLAGTKRSRGGDDGESEGGASGGRKPKRGRTASLPSAADLSEDDRFLVQLKEEENLPWKDIATRFQTDKSKNFQVAALQMRYKRLREKYRVWEEQDLQALKLAHEYWEKYKWEIISAKMLDFGIQERWPSRHCSKKWQELEAASAVPHPAAAAAAAAAGVAGLTPASMPYSSPIEGAQHQQQQQQQQQQSVQSTTTRYAFMPNTYQGHP